MKTLEFPGVKIDDVGSVWYDLLKKGFDVHSVGAGADSTIVYVDDSEDKNPQPILENWVGKPLPEMSRSSVEKRRKEIMQLLEDARKARVQKAADIEQEAAERRLSGKPELKVTATGQTGMLGVAEALSNGVDSHTILIQKVDPEEKLVEGSEDLVVSVSHKVPISTSTPKLDGGMAMIQIGPSHAVGDLTVEVKDKTGSMKPVKLPLRFVIQRTTDREQPTPPSLVKNGGIMSVIKTVFGI